jgi:spore germination protein YaaH
VDQKEVIFGERRLRNRLYLVLFLALAACFFWFLWASAAFAVPDGGLQLGSRGGDVGYLQERLKEAGFYPSGEMSCYFGLTTYLAVIALERAAGLTVDGVVNEPEWQLLTGDVDFNNPLISTKLRKAVIGYYVEDYPGDRLSYNSLADNGKHIDCIVTFSFLVDRDGNLNGEAGEGVDLAGRMNVRSLLLVHNIGSKIDTETAHIVLSDTKKRRNLEQNILAVLRSAGYDGVNIDLEGILPEDRENYNLLIRELKELFKPDGFLLTVSIPAKTADNPADLWNGAYDYKTIGRLADLVMLMTYDEHWFGSEPGPVASVPWVERVLSYTVGVIPRDKLLMGIAAYGYDWSATGGRAVTWREVNNLVSWYGNVQWDNYYSVPFMEYYNEEERHEVWFENVYSLRIKLGLVEKYGLAGIAIWRLGFEDESFWEIVSDTFAN